MPHRRFTFQGHSESLAGCLTLTAWSRCSITSRVCGRSRNLRRASGPTWALRRLQTEAAAGAEGLFGQRDARGWDVMGETARGHCRMGGSLAGQERQRWWDGRRGEQGKFRLQLSARPPAFGEVRGARWRPLLHVVSQRGGATAFGHGAGGWVHVGVLHPESGALPGQGRLRGHRGGRGEVEGRPRSVVIQEKMLRSFEKLPSVTRGRRGMSSWRTKMHKWRLWHAWQNASTSNYVKLSLRNGLAFRITSLKQIISTLSTVSLTSFAFIKHPHANYA